MYQPPTEATDSEDEYQSYEFNIAFKGFSKASASSVIKKIKNGGKCTDREKIVEYFYNIYKSDSIEELQKILEKLNKTYKDLQTEIQHIKFAIILINRGCMDEFNSRENMTLDIDVSKYEASPIDTVNVSFKVVQKAVKI